MLMLMLIDADADADGIRCYIKRDSIKNSSNALHSFHFRICTT